MRSVLVLFVAASCSVTKPSSSILVREKPVPEVQRPTESAHVVDQRVYAEKHRRVRTPTHDWQLLWSNYRMYRLSVRDAASGFVLYQLDDWNVVSAGVNPDRGLLCAILAGGSKDRRLFAVGWDLARARELWRHELPDADPKLHDFYGVVVLGDRCLLAGKQAEVAFDLSHGKAAKLPASDLRRAVVAAAESVAISTGEGLAVVRTHRIGGRTSSESPTRCLVAVPRWPVQRALRPPRSSRSSFPAAGVIPSPP